MMSSIHRFVTYARRLALAGLLVLVPQAALAQDATNERGFAAEKVYSFGEIDSVNLFNGNLALTIPIGGSYPVNGGTSFGLRLVYNSNIWDFTSRQVWVQIGSTWELTSIPQALIGRSFNAGVGWTLSLGRLYGSDHGHNPSAARMFNYIGEDGGQHDFYRSLHASESEEPSTVFYTRDGSYLRLKLSEPFSDKPGIYRVAQVETQDGSVRRFERDSSHHSSEYRVKSIKNAFGTAITISYPTATRWELFDGHRKHFVHFVAKTVEGQTAYYVSRVEMAGFAGTTAEYTFTYEDLVFDRHPQSEDTEEIGATTTGAMLTQIALPDGSFWRMPKLRHFTAQADGPGLIGLLELPTLGKLEWTWRTYSYPQRSDGVGGQTLSVVHNYGIGTKRVLNSSGSCHSMPGVGCQ